jgi:pimeloyl-ACP methyl ester carboxylesterase
MGILAPYGARRFGALGEDRMALDTNVARETGSVMGLEANFVDVDGIRTRYYEVGQQNEDVLLLIHGFFFDHKVSANTWMFNLAGLGQRYHVFAPDKMGHGLSDNPKSFEEYTQHHLVQHMWAFMQKVGIQKAAVFGQSNGAYTAARLALEHPDACWALILSDTGTLGPEVGNMAERRAELYKDIPTDNPREGLRYRWEQLGYTRGDVTDEYLDAALYMESTALGQAMIADVKNGAMEANRRRFPGDKEETLRWMGEGRLTMPVLITWGANDPSAILPIGHQLFELVSQKSDRVQMHIFNHVGHFHFREIPDEWNDVVMTFLAHSK